MAGLPTIPFLLTLGDDIPPSDTVPYRYDRDRQIGQVLVDGSWVDANSIAAPIAAPATGFTKVARESTDEQ